MSAFEHIFTASDSFNLHIERVRGGFLALSRRTSGEGWDLLSSLPNVSTIDADVYNDREREYKIVSDELPTLCKITFADGTVEDVEIPDKPVEPDTPVDPDTPSDVPTGYETFELSDGEFEVTEGTFYVKL